MLILPPPCARSAVIKLAFCHITLWSPTMASTNTDVLFDADATTQARVDARARSRSQKSHPKSRSKRTASGALDHPTYEDTPPPYEQTPLLERALNSQEDTSDESSIDGSERSAPEWSGARDFEGRPWWRKPSVSQHPLLLMLLVETDYIRPSGFYRPSC